MGCDIHTVVELKKGNEWVGIDELPEEFNERNYSTFAFLANVRNRFNTKGFEPKGYPSDMSEKSKKELKEEWAGDFHSESYLTLKELDDCDKSDYNSEKCRVVGAFYEKFKELGGVLPKEMKVEEEIISNSILDIIGQQICPDIIVKWENSEDTLKKTPVFRGIEALKEIAKKNDIDNFENIRIVFCFDN